MKAIAIRRQLTKRGRGGELVLKIKSDLAFERADSPAGWTQLVQVGGEPLEILVTAGRADDERIASPMLFEEDKQRRAKEPSHVHIGEVRVPAFPRGEKARKELQRGAIECIADTGN
ncbi:hypothetical protein KM043_015358 [Ampulex compressa]|nr:hypothetical protein KM043_015358 [Ampulex compressa]